MKKKVSTTQPVNQSAFPSHSAADLFVYVHRLLPVRKETSWASSQMFVIFGQNDFYIKLKKWEKKALLESCPKMNWTTKTKSLFSGEKQGSSTEDTHTCACIGLNEKQMYFYVIFTRENDKHNWKEQAILAAACFWYVLHMN